MASEYDLYSHPELNPAVQNKVARSIQRIAKLCVKVCYRNQTPTDECLANCSASYIQTFQLVLDSLENISKRQT